MAFLLFAFMKSSLRQRIDHKEFRLTQIMNKINNMQEQQSIMAQAKTASQSALSMFYQSNNMLANNAYQQSIFGLQSGFGKYQEEYSKALKDNNNDTANAAVVKSHDAMITAQTNAQAKYQELMADFQKVQMGNQMSQQLMSSIFTSADQMQATSIHAQETQLTTEKDSLESELKLLNGQYDSYKQQEEKAAKDMAPNFGQGS